MGGRIRDRRRASSRIARIRPAVRKTGRGVPQIRSSLGLSVKTGRELQDKFMEGSLPVVVWRVRHCWSFWLSSSRSASRDPL